MWACKTLAEQHKAKTLAAGAAGLLQESMHLLYCSGSHACKPLEWWRHGLLFHVHAYILHPINISA